MNLHISFSLGLSRWQRAYGPQPEARFWHVYISLWVGTWRVFVERARNRDLSGRTEWFASIGNIPLSR